MSAAIRLERGDECLDMLKTALQLTFRSSEPLTPRHSLSYPIRRGRRLLIAETETAKAPSVELSRVNS